MGCARGCMKCFLIVFNLIFVIIGGILLALGIILRFFLDSLLSGVLSSLLEAVPFDVTSFTQLPPPFDQLIQDITAVAGLAFICMGGVMLFVGLMGCCGACGEGKKCCLITYVIFVSILLAAQIGAIVYFFIKRDDIEKTARTELQDSINKEYQGDNGTDVTSIAWTLINKAFTCCGISDYTNFHMATQWNRTYSYNYTTSGFSFLYSVTLQTPLSCCKFDGGFLSYSLTNPNCSVDPKPEWSNYQTGCFDKLMGVIDGAPTITVGLVCGTAFGVQLLLIICACCLTKKEKKGDDDVTKF